MGLFLQPYVLCLRLKSILTITRAYLGNQQFTISHFIFVNCVTALQIHWDWGFTMQDIVIENCGTGILVIGGVSYILFHSSDGLDTYTKFTFAIRVYKLNLT